MPEHDRPPVRISTRLWFAWFGLVAVLVTIPASIVQMITNVFTPTARNFKRWATIWARLILGPAGIRVTLQHTADLDPERPYVFLANHQNTLDILSLAAKVPHPFGYVAKKELTRVPLLGLAMRHSASILIDRSHPRKSLQSIKEAAERIRSGNSVMIYPEGARSYAPGLRPFKRGGFLLAVEAGVPIVPVTVVDAYRLMDERRYVGRPGRIRVVLGTPIPTEDVRRGDVPQLIAAVRRQMEAVLQPEIGPAEPYREEQHETPSVERAAHHEPDQPDTSMALSTDEVRYIARLARLQFSSEEEERLARDMGKVLDYVDTLNELDTSGVPPMSHVLDLTNVQREDDVAQRISHDDALSNAPDADSDYFRVPKVID